jgi:hypothetical protein
MRTAYWKWVSTVGALALTFSVVPVALGQCGLPNKQIKPSAWRPQIGAASPRLLATAFDDDKDEHGPSIVGMWHAVFTAHTENGVAIPIAAGVVIDNSVVVWHSDGTEIMNSARPAQDGSFCLGVWKHTGDRTYLLNHIPWMGNVFDPTAPPSAIGAPQGGAQIIEKITLSQSGDSYTGSFTLQAYNADGSTSTSFTGTISAKRITPETDFTSLL